MVRVWFVLFLMALSNLRFSSAAVGSDNSTVPEFLNIGVLYSFNTSVGRIVKIAVETAVGDINSDSSILGKTKLKLSMQEDSKYRGFLSIAEGTFFCLICDFVFRYRTYFKSYRLWLLYWTRCKQRCSSWRHTLWPLSVRRHLRQLMSYLI